MSSHAGKPGHLHLHISPVRLYLAVWIGLMILTAITVGVAQVDFGPLNVVVAMAVATFKALLVVLFFMHLKYDKPFHAVALSIGVVFFGLLLGLTLLDVGTRTDPEPSRNFAPLAAPNPLAGKTPGGHGGAASETHAAPTGEAKAAEGEKKEAAAEEKKAAPAAPPAAAPAQPAEKK